MPHDHEAIMRATSGLDPILTRGVSNGPSVEDMRIACSIYATRMPHAASPSQNALSALASAPVEQPPRRRRRFLSASIRLVAGLWSWQVARTPQNRDRSEQRLWCGLTGIGDNALPPLPVEIQLRL